MMEHMRITALSHLDLIYGRRTHTHINVGVSSGWSFSVRRNGQSRFRLHLFVSVCLHLGRLSKLCWFCSQVQSASDLCASLKRISSPFHNIFLSPVPLISVFSFNSVPYNCRGQMEACDFRHTQIKSLLRSLSGEIGKDSWIPFASLFVYVSHRQQMLEGVRSSNTQTHFLTVLYTDWFAFLGQKA